MREKDLSFDRTKHVCYTKNAKKCVQKLLHRYYDDPDLGYPGTLRGMKKT